MWKSLLVGLLAYVLAEEEGSCMLQKKQTQHKLIAKDYCEGTQKVLNFNNFSHGDEVLPDSIPGVTIEATRRATEPEPGFPKNCSGPLLILDTRDPDFRSFDKDLKNCENCTLMLWSKDGNRNKVNDCGEHPGVMISFKYEELQDLIDIELWDLEEPTFIELYGKDGELLKNISSPDGPDQDGNPAVVDLMTDGVKEMIVYMGGSGAVRKIRSCEPAPPFCPGPPGELTFNSFSHGDEILPDSIRGVTIEATRRATEPEPGFPKNCSGPLLILDTRDPDGRSFDKDLKRCENCTLMLWSKDGNRRKVNDCGEHPGVMISFKFRKLQSLVDIELWDLEEPTFIELYGADGELLKNVSAPDGPEQDGNPAIVELLTEGVKEMIVYMGGSGAIRRIRACKAPGSIVGDPHIYTLDGDKFDFYQNGTFSVFHYAGQKLPHPTKKNATVDWQLYSHYGGPFWTAQGVLLVDRSMGSMRQALELTSKDCQWYKKAGKTWSLLTYTDEESDTALTMFEHVHEKKIDTLVLNTVCKPSGINMRISMPDMRESWFLEGQIEVGNGEEQKKFARKQPWTALGGSGPAATFIEQLESKKGLSLLTACGEAEKAKAKQLCAKHLRDELRTAQAEAVDLLNDCVNDVCRGGEEFAVAAKELLTAYRE
eukprot:s4807_g6.t1